MNETIIGYKPDSEWAPAMQQVFDLLGATIERKSAKDYQQRISIPRLNLEFEAISGRIADTPSVVLDPLSIMVAGLCGTDTLRNMKAADGQYLRKLRQPNTDFVIPLDDLGVTYEPSQVMWQASELNKPENIPLEVLTPVLVAELGGRVATSLLILVEQFFSELGLGIQNLITLTGTVEGAPYYYPTCLAVIDIVVSGKTNGANKLKPLFPIFKADPVLFENPDKMNPVDAKRLSVFKEALTETAYQRSKRERIFPYQGEGRGAPEFTVKE
jgi:ATP phosphoribosyltransferase